MYLRSVPGYEITDNDLVEIFYGALDTNSQAYADTTFVGFL